MKRYLTLATATAATMAFAPVALAVTSTTLVITEEQENVPEERIQLFDSGTGVEVKPTEDDDDESILFLLEGGTYRVVVDGKPVREISVTGTGSQVFNIGIPLSGPSASSAEPWTELTDDQRAAIRSIMAPPPDLVSIFFGGGIGRTDVPHTSGGVVRTNSSDEGPAGVGSDRLDTVFFEAGINFPIGGVPAFIKGRYTAGNSQSSPFTVAPGSVDAAGFSFGQETDGSTGIILSSFGGVSGTLDADLHEIAMQLGVRLPLGGKDSSSIFSINPFARFSQRTTRLDSDLFLTTDIPDFIFDIGQQREDRIRDTWYTVGITPSVDVLLAPAVSVHLDLTGEVGIFRSSLNSVENNRCDVCGPEHQNFTIETIDRNSGLHFRGGAGAGLNFHLSPQSRLGVFGRADLFRIGGVSHPVTGDDVLAGDTTHLERENGFGMSAGVSFESWW